MHSSITSSARHVSLRVVVLSPSSSSKAHWNKIAPPPQRKVYYFIDEFIHVEPVGLFPFPSYFLGQPSVHGLGRKLLLDFPPPDSFFSGAITNFLCRCQLIRIYFLWCSFGMHLAPTANILLTHQKRWTTQFQFANIWKIKKRPRIEIALPETHRSPASRSPLPCTTSDTWLTEASVFG